MKVVSHATSHKAGSRCMRWASIIAVVVSATFALAPAANAQQTWTNGGGDGLWSNLSNWAGGTPGIYRDFGDAGVGSSTANAYQGPMWQLRVFNSTGTHAVNLASGTVFMNTFATLEIGRNATGAIQFSNGTFSVAQAGSSPLRLGRADGGPDRRSGFRRWAGPG